MTIAMKVGILESREDPFILDVASQLADFELDFLSFKEQSIPLNTRYSVIIDRLSFRQVYLLEIMKDLSLGGVYIINNPFSASETNKIVESKVCQALNIPHPVTVVLPDQNAREALPETILEPDLEQVVARVGLPCVVKPYNGFGWENVFFVSSMEELRNICEAKRRDHVLLVQQQIKYVDYYRAFCIDKKEVLFVKWIPRPLAMGEYLVNDLKSIEACLETMTQQTIQLNSALDLDINAVEWCIDERGTPWLIEAFNEVPDIDKRSIPEPYYKWIVEKFSLCVREKALAGARNRTIFQPTASAFEPEPRQL